MQMTLFVWPAFRKAEGPRSLHGGGGDQFTLADAAPSIWFIVLVGLISILAFGSMSMIEAASQTQHALTCRSDLLRPLAAGPCP
jgi:hypothetical protein